MKVSQFFLSTLKESPAEAELISHQLMLRAGLIRKLASGLYSWMPLGLRVLQKVEAIVREEMNRAGALELLMPAVQPAELWEESGRWVKYGPELLRFKDRHQRDFCFGPTHEEIITDIARREIKSYRQLPVNFYQIQTKFRDEVRPRFGIMRAREFLMKDSYSFHASQESLQKTYDVMYETYTKIFTRVGLQFRAVRADNGAIGGSSSHEFHVLADSGEDQIAYCPDSDFASNVELINAGNVAEGDASPDGKGTLKICRGIEVGHIFQLGTNYSEKLKAMYLDEQGQEKPMIMGCYGIGVSRIVAAAIEQQHDAKGICFPQSIAPFRVSIVPIGFHKSEWVRNTAQKLHDDLHQLGIEVLLDDRDERPGAMFADHELIGTPHRITIGERGLAKDEIEYQTRHEGNAIPIPLANSISFIQEQLR